MTNIQAYKAGFEDTTTRFGQNLRNMERQKVARPRAGPPSAAPCCEDSAGGGTSTRVFLEDVKLDGVVADDAAFQRAREEFKKQELFGPTSAVPFSSSSRSGLSRRSRSGLLAQRSVPAFPPLPYVPPSASAAHIWSSYGASSAVVPPWSSQSQGGPSPTKSAPIWSSSSQGGKNAPIWSSSQDERGANAKSAPTWSTGKNAAPTWSQHHGKTKTLGPSSQKGKGQHQFSPHHQKGKGQHQSSHHQKGHHVPPRSAATKGQHFPMGNYSPGGAGPSTASGPLQSWTAPNNPGSTLQSWPTPNNPGSLQLAPSTDVATQQLADLTMLNVSDARLLLLENGGDLERSAQAYFEDPSVVSSLRLAADLSSHDNREWE